MFKWIPGHKGMEGNEKANEQVKKAITEGSSNAQNLPKMLKDTLPHSKSALKQAHNEKLNRKAQKIWKIKNLPRCLANVLTQLWMGHAPLAKHLHCIKKGTQWSVPVVYCIWKPYNTSYCTVQQTRCQTDPALQYRKKHRHQEVIYSTQNSSSTLQVCGWHWKILQKYGGSHPTKLAN